MGKIHGETTMVPALDCFNHGGESSGLQKFLDAERGEFVLTATRAHARGEELLFSYGRKSNVLLFRAHGFTLPPQLEPSWTFICQDAWKPQEVYRQFLPRRHQDLTIVFDTDHIDDSLITAMNSCTEIGTNPEEFLRCLLNH